MQKQNTWLDAAECSEALAIRPMRLAQLMRCRLIPFVTAVGGPLFHKLHVEWVAESYPQMIAWMREENAVDNAVEEGELRLCSEAYPPEWLPNRVIVVKRIKGSIPNVRPPNPASREG